MAFMCLLGSAVMGIVLPVFEFPVPTGSFSVGSTTRHLVDAMRPETQSSRGEERRELMLQIWFPAEQGGTRQYYRTNTPANLKNLHLRLVKLHSFSGVPVARVRYRYPVLIFSPSWSGNYYQYTFLAEELASHGYIVIGIDHPYGSAFTTFPDGRTIPTALDKFLDYSSDEALQASIHVVEAQLRIRTADVRFTLDTLERLDQQDPSGLLVGRIDASRVGVFGHSFGGAVAAEVCQTDPRFKAGINFDGLLFGESGAKGVKRPFLFVSDDGPGPTASALANASGSRKRYLMYLDQDVQAIRRSLIVNGGYYLAIRGASHMQFCDRPLYSPIKRLTEAGPIDARRAMAIINAYTVAFFDKHLSSLDNGLLDGASPQYPDVSLEKWPIRGGT
jgi:predicted dienelactone hydrolase